MENAQIQADHHRLPSCVQEEHAETRIAETEISRDKFREETTMVAAGVLAERLLEPIRANYLSPFLLLRLLKELIIK